MFRLSSRLRLRIRSMISDYELLLWIAMVLVLIQMGCLMVGCLAIHVGAGPTTRIHIVPMADLVMAFFALEVIWSRRQELCRSYALLLVVLVVLDVVWLRLYAQPIWTAEPGSNCRFLVYLLRIASLMQVIGFLVRLLSSLLWIQICRLGSLSVYNTSSCESNSEERDSWLYPTNQDIATHMQNPTYEVTNKILNSDETSGVVILDPFYCSYLPKKPQDEVQIICHDRGSETSQHNSAIRSLVSICNRMQNPHDRYLGTMMKRACDMGTQNNQVRDDITGRKMI